MFNLNLLSRFLLSSLILLALGSVLFAADTLNVDKKLSDLIPETKNQAFFNNFIVKKVVKTDDSIKVLGTIDGKFIAIDKSYTEKKSFTITGDNINIGDIIEATKNITFLKKFALDKIIYSPAALSVEGKLNNKFISVVKTLTGTVDTITITGADIQLSDVIPQTKKLKFLNRFKLDKIVHSASLLSVDGKINHKAITLTTSTIEKETTNSKKSFSLVGSDIEISDIFQETKSITFLKKFKFDKLIVDSDTIEVDGKIASKDLKLTKDRKKAKHIEITASKLTLGDIFEVLKPIGALNILGFDKILLDDKYIEIQTELNGDKITLLKHKGEVAKSNYVAIFFKELEASTFIPAADGTVINDLSLNKALFIILSEKVPLQTLKVSELPKDISSLMGSNKNKSIKLKSGVNILATLDVKKSGDLATLLEAVGIDGKSLSLEGTLSKSSFKGLAKKGRKAARGAKVKANSLSKVDKKAMLEDLSLTVDIPTPNLSGMTSAFKIKQPATLSINSRGSDDFWSKLPLELQKKRPQEKLEFSLNFDVEFDTASHKETMSALVDMGKTGKKSSLVLLALSQKPWKKPFGIEKLTINSGGFELKLDKSAKGSNKEIAFFGSADYSSHKNISISADIVSENSKIKLNYFSIDEKITLSSIDGAKNLPYSDKFELDEIKLSADGIEAKTVIASKRVNAYLFKTSSTSGWTFAIEQKDFKITELLPFFKNSKILSALSLPKAALIISEKGFSETRDEIPDIAKDMFDDILGKSSLDVKIPSGIGFVADFDPSAMGPIGEGLSKLGVHDEAIIMGEFTGVFKGTPGFKLDVKMEKIGKVSALPKKVMSFKKVIPDYYFQFATEDLYVGAELDMQVKAGKDKLTLATKIELQFSEKGIGVDVLGEMDSVWHNPFGIKFLSLANLKMEAGINDIGEVKIGFAGDQKIGEEDIKIATEIDMLLEDLLPDGVAFSGEMNNIGAPAIIEIAEDLMSVKGELSKIPMPYFEVHDAIIAFATPGATDPQLGLVSEGFAFKGKFFFMNRELGMIDGAGGPKGITLKGDIADIDLDIIEFKKNNLDIAINLTPKFIINSDIKLLDTEEKVFLDIKPPKMQFDINANMGAFGAAFLNVTMDGLDLKTGKFDKNADISMIGEFKSTLVPWMKTEITKGIKELHKSATKKLDDDKKKLDKATAKVDKINKKIAKLKARDKRAKQRADAKFDSLERRVSHLKKAIHHDKYKAKHCGNKWTHWSCKGYWKAKEKATKLVYKVADGALKAAKKVVNSATDLDPEIAEQYAQRDIELAALALAKGVVEVSQEAEDFVLNKLSKALNTALNDLPFEIDRAIMIGDLQGMMNNKPMVLDMKYKIFSDTRHDYFAIKLKDPAYDAVSFALLPAIALDKLVESIAKDINPKAAKWMSAHIGAKIADAEQKIRKEVLAEEEKYKDVLDSFSEGSAKFKQAYEDVENEKSEIVSTYQVSDMMGDSKVFSQRYLAIGHSSLCLAISPNGIDVYQANCKDIESERWSAKKIEDGYVQLKSKGLCLKSKNAVNKEGQPLMLAECNSDDEHEKWKVISSDGFFDQIVNKFSQQCLHFDSENANPKTAYAVWTSCIGTDSQTFRDISDAQRPTWHHVNDEIKSKSGSCLSTKANFDSYFTLSKGHETTTQVKKNQMLHKKDDILITKKCDKESNEYFSFVENVDGDVKLVHAKSGWCVVPKHDTQQSLSLAPCDRGKDMFWRNKLIKGDSFQMYNITIRKCLALKALKEGSKQGSRAQLEECKNISQQQIDFIK